MSERYRLRHLPIEIDRHPTFTTDYIARVEIVDTRSNKTVETVEAYGKESGVHAVKEARKTADEWIAEREQQEPVLSRISSRGNSAIPPKAVMIILLA